MIRSDIKRELIGLTIEQIKTFKEVVNDICDSRIMSLKFGHNKDEADDE